MSTESSQNPIIKTRPHRKRIGPDAAPFGLLVGLLFPIVGLSILYFVWSGDTTLVNYIKMFAAFDSPVLMSTASKALSLAMITNLIPFYFFLNRKQYMTVRGILISMVLIGVMIVLYKFVWQ
jgi:hypothetical protein